MSHALLHRIAKGPLPMHFSAPDDLDAVAILKDGGWIKAQFTYDGPQAASALVTELTAVGRLAMRFVQPSDRD